MSEGASFLPYGRQLIEEDDIAAVIAALRSDYLTTGPAVEAFEADLRARLQVAEAISCNSGTAALHLAIIALGLGPGDAVIVPAITFVASANCAKYQGAEVVFADVDPDTGLMRVEDCAVAFDRATAAGLCVRAIIPVHLAGQAIEMSELWAFARARDLYVVEDACHALGTVCTDTDGTSYAIGSCRYSHMACFSFHPVKTVAMGEGGALVTNDPALAAAARRARSHGLVRDESELQLKDLAFDSRGRANPWYYEMPDYGFNYRSPDVLCALARSQLAKLDRFIAERRRLVARYDAGLEGLAPVVRPLARTERCTPGWHLNVSLIDFEKSGRDRADVMHALREKGIGTQVHYIPVPWQPYYRRAATGEAFPGAASYYARALSLPLFVGMSEHDVDRVIATLAAVLGLQWEAAYAPGPAPA